MKAKTTKTTSKNISGAQRPIDVYFPFYAQRFPSVGDKIILSILLLCLYFALMGLVWAIPFPQFKWLNSYIGYFNWASFLIAGLMYSWIKQSPVISYFLLILLFAISYGVSQMAETSALIGPPLWTICGPILIAAIISLFIIGKKRSSDTFLINIFRLPVWLVSFLAKSFGARL